MQDDSNGRGEQAQAFDPSPKCPSCGYSVDWVLLAATHENGCVEVMCVDCVGANLLDDGATIEKASRQRVRVRFVELKG